jgi:hypothetical protein
MTQTEALKLALEALEVANSLVDGYYLPKEKAWLPEIEEAITAIKAALEAKDEPVAGKRLELIGHADLGINNIYIFNGYGEEVPEGRTPLYAGYTTPPPVAEPHKRKPLTDEQKLMCWARATCDADVEHKTEHQCLMDYAYEIEAAHGIKGEA